MVKVEIAQFRLSKRIKQRLAKAAERSDRTVSELLREYLSRGLDEDEARAAAPKRENG